jgi:hypothetical protein
VVECEWMGGVGFIRLRLPKLVWRSKANSLPHECVVELKPPDILTIRKFPIDLDYPLSGLQRSRETPHFERARSRASAVLLM